MTSSNRSGPNPAGTPRPARTTPSLDALQGLSVGDALGAQFFVPANRRLLDLRQAPPGRWPWTDDTEMACSVHAALTERGRIDGHDLTHAFAHRHDFDRGYGPAANRLLRLIREGGDARRLAAELFDGQGSYGNGAAMRVAPLGAAFAHDPAAAVGPAAATAVITHTHPQAVDGAVAVAVAAALAVRTRGERPAPADFLTAVMDLTPHGAVRRGIGEAAALAGTADPHAAARLLGNGGRVSAADTVPFALWAAARHLDDYPRAIWDTVTAGGDVDTTAAIAGGVVAAHTGTAGIPAAWRAAREALPAWASPEPGTVADPAFPPPGVRPVPMVLPRPVEVPALTWTEREWQHLRSDWGTGSDWLRYTAEGVLHVLHPTTGHVLLAVAVEVGRAASRRPVAVLREAHPGRWAGTGPLPADALLAALRHPGGAAAAGTPGR